MRIALVTASGGPAWKGEVDLPLVAALAGRDVEVVRPAWDDAAVPWEGFDAAVIRTTWDYASRRDEFLGWAERAGEATRLWNPPEVIRWNTHKSYLMELEERGAPVVPTAWLGRGDQIDLAALLATRGWERAVVKPAVGAGAEGLVRVDPDEDRELRSAQAAMERLLAAGDVLVQPYLASVEARGELSVVLVEGRPTHAVRKTPAPGEYRVQSQFGGRYELEPIDDDLTALATWVVEATGNDLLQARVDLLEDEVGTPQLVELELTEPDLYLTAAPFGADELASAVVRRVEESEGRS